MTEQEEQQLDEIIADFLQSQEAGEPVTEEQLLHNHPEFFEELREFFDNLGQMDKLAGPLTTPVLDKLRYFGDYELLEEISRGGMGIIYKARQTSLNRIVAVKLILAGQLASETDVKRFQAEAESAANLQHPHIVSVFEVGRHQKQSYFSMEYIDGKNLSEIARDHPLPPQQAAGYVREMAEAIHYAHQQGTLHRDIKPSNVLIDQNDRVKITDFGLAMKVEGDSELTRTGQVLGTPSYMPPEQAQHIRELIGPASDIYSMGAILYELLTGRPPFQSDSSIETLRQVIETEPLSPRQLNPAVPKDLETICLKCLQKEPHKRYAKAQELADDLGRFLQNEPILARPIGLLERGWRWTKRRPAVAGLSLLLALSLVVGTIVSSMFAIESGQNAEFYHNEFQRAERLLGEKGRLLDEKTKLTDDLENALVGQKQATATAKRNAQIAEQRRLEADLHAERARRQSYINDLNRAQSDFDEGKMERVRALLNRHLPQHGWNDLRGFEWFYWDQNCPYLAELKGHDSSVLDVAFSPDGTIIASGSGDRTIKLWDSRTEQELFTLIGHTGTVRKVAFSPDGSRLASASEDRTIRLWDVKTGQELFTLKGHKSFVTYVTFNPDGTRIASAGRDRVIKLWDATTGQELLTLSGSRSSFSSVAFSLDSTRMASANADRSITLWDVAMGQETHVLKGHEGSVLGMAFGPDGTRIASASSDGTVKLWDVVTGYELLSFTGHQGVVQGVAFSPDGTRIASAGRDQTIKLWDAATGQKLLTLTGHSGFVYNVAFNPDGSRLASAGRDQTVKLWDVVTGKELLTLTGHQNHVRSVALSPDGTQIASASSDQTVKLWDAATGEELLTLIGHKDAVLCVAFSPDGTQVASASSDQMVKLWDMTTNQELQTLAGHKGPVNSVAFSPDGKQVVSTSSDRMVKLWDVATGKEFLTLAGHKSSVISVAFSPDGTRIASASADQTVKLWDAATGQELLTLTGHTGFVYHVAFSPDGTRIASASTDQTVKIWDALTGINLQSLSGHKGAVLGVAFSPDGTRIASSSYDQTVKLWDTLTGQELLTLKGHTNRVYSVSFGVDGRQLISGSDDSTIRVWHEFKIPEKWSFDLPRRISDYKKLLKQRPPDLKPYYTLCLLLRYVGDFEGYKEVCRNMLEEYSNPDKKFSEHTLLMAYVFFPEADVTPEILKIAKQHAAGNNLINDRMLAMTYHRLGRNEEALPLLEAAAKQQNASADSKLTTLLSLALVQLELERFEEASKTIHKARDLYLQTGASSGDSEHRKPWGLITSLWREVASSMEGTPVENEPIPQLPPPYENLPRSDEAHHESLTAPRPE